MMKPLDGIQQFMEERNEGSDGRKSSDLFWKETTVNIEQNENENHLRRGVVVGGQRAR